MRDGKYWSRVSEAGARTRLLNHSNENKNQRTLQLGNPAYVNSCKTAPRTPTLCLEILLIQGETSQSRITYMRVRIGVSNDYCRLR